MYAKIIQHTCGYQTDHISSLLQTKYEIFTQFSSYLLLIIELTTDQKKLNLGSIPGIPHTCLLLMARS